MISLPQVIRKKAAVVVEELDVILVIQRMTGVENLVEFTGCFIQR